MTPSDDTGVGVAGDHFVAAENIYAAMKRVLGLKKW